MAKLTGPLFSFGAKGKLGNVLIFQTSKQRRTAKIFASPTDKKTVLQLQQRSVFKSAVAFWNVARELITPDRTDKGPSFIGERPLMPYAMWADADTTITASMPVFDPGTINTEYLSFDPLKKNNLQSDVPAQPARILSGDYYFQPDGVNDFIPMDQTPSKNRTYAILIKFPETRPAEGQAIAGGTGQSYDHDNMNFYHLSTGWWWRGGGVDHQTQVLFAFDPASYGEWHWVIIDKDYDANMFTFSTVRDRLSYSTAAHPFTRETSQPRMLYASIGGGSVGPGADPIAAYIAWPRLLSEQEKLTILGWSTPDYIHDPKEWFKSGWNRLASQIGSALSGYVRFSKAVLKSGHIDEDAAFASTMVPELSNFRFIVETLTGAAPGSEAGSYFITVGYSKDQMIKRYSIALGEYEPGADISADFAISETVYAQLFFTEVSDVITARSGILKSVLF